MVYNCTCNTRIKCTFLNLELFLLIENLCQLYFYIPRTSRYLLDNIRKVLNDESGVKDMNIECPGCCFAIISFFLIYETLYVNTSMLIYFPDSTISYMFYA